MKATTQAQFKEIRNNRYTVIRFKGDKRVSTYSNVGVHKLQLELLAATEAGLTCLVFESGKEPRHSSYNLADYIYQ